MFTQQGQKLVGTGAVGAGEQGNSVSPMGTPQHRGLRDNENAGAAASGLDSLAAVGECPRESLPHMAPPMAWETITLSETDKCALVAAALRKIGGETAFEPIFAPTDTSKVVEVAVFVRVVTPVDSTGLIIGNPDTVGQVELDIAGLDDQTGAAALPSRASSRSDWCCPPRRNTAALGEPPRSNQRMQRTRARWLWQPPRRRYLTGGRAAAAASALAADAPVR